MQEKSRTRSTVHFTAASTGWACNLIKFYSAARGARLFQLSSKQDKSSIFATSYNHLTTMLFTAVMCSLHGQRKWWKWQRTTWLVSKILNASLQCLHKEEEEKFSVSRSVARMDLTLQRLSTPPLPPPDAADSYLCQTTLADAGNQRGERDLMLQKGKTVSNHMQVNTTQYLVGMWVTSY